MGPQSVSGADSAFRGDSALLNSEQLVVMAASSCRLLSFLSVAAQHHVDIVGYVNAARGAAYRRPTDADHHDRLVPSDSGRGGHRGRVGQASGAADPRGVLRGARHRTPAAPVTDRHTVRSNGCRSAAPLQASTAAGRSTGSLLGGTPQEGGRLFSGEESFGELLPAQSGAHLDSQSDRPRCRIPSQVPDAWRDGDDVADDRVALFAIDEECRAAVEELKPLFHFRMNMFEGAVTEASPRRVCMASSSG